MIKEKGRCATGSDDELCGRQEILYEQFVFHFSLETAVPPLRRAEDLRGTVGRSLTPPMRCIIGPDRKNLI
jgi:hypothetical protein